MNKLFKIFNSPAFQVAFVLMILSFFINKLKSNTNTKSENPNTKVVTSPTITISEAKRKASRLVGFMGGIGTDEQSIIDTFNGLNKSDFNLIYNQFGLVKYEPFTGTEGVYFGQPKDLVFWLFNEMSKTELKPLIKRFNLSL